MNDYITIGQVLKASGIRGEFKVKPLTDDAERYKKLKLVYIGGTPKKITSMRFDGGFVYLKVTGIEDRTAAESLKDAFIEIDRINAVELDEGSYFISDIVGCKVFTDDGTEIGKVTDVSQYGAADVYTVSDGRRTVRFPFLKKLIVKVDVETGVIVLYKSVFDEVSVYED